MSNVAVISSNIRTVFCSFLTAAFLTSPALAYDDLKAPELSKEEINALGSGIFKCLKGEHRQDGWERKHADRTRQEDFFEHVSLSYKEDVEREALNNGAVYRLVAVNYERNSQPFINTAYVTVLQRPDGKVLIRPEVRQMGGTKFSRFSGRSCRPGEWLASIDDFMVDIEKPKVPEVILEVKKEPNSKGNKTIRTDLVGSWTCEGKGKQKNKDKIEPWNVSTNLKLDENGKFHRTLSIFHGDDIILTTSNGRWFADDTHLTVKTSFQNIDQMIVDGEEIPKLVLALGSLVDGLAGTVKDNKFEIKKRGWIFSRITLEEQGNYPVSCEHSEE